jgi:hypothetical protein
MPAPWLMAPRAGTALALPPRHDDRPSVNEAVVQRDPIDIEPGTALAQLLDRLGTSRRGLSTGEAERRLRAWGPNEPRTRSVRAKIFGVVRLIANPLVVILLVAGTASALLRQVADAAIIFVIAASSAALNAWQTMRSARAVRRLQQQIAPTAVRIAERRRRERPIRGGVIDARDDPERADLQRTDQPPPRPPTAIPGVEPEVAPLASAWRVSRDLGAALAGGGERAARRSPVVGSGRGSRRATLRGHRRATLKLGVGSSESQDPRAGRCASAGQCMVAADAVDQSVVTLGAGEAREHTRG